MQVNFIDVSKLIMACGVLVLVLVLVVSSGCMSMAKTTYKTLDDLSGTPYPTPTPTAPVTMIPERVDIPAAVVSIVPIPTENKADYMERTNGRDEKELYKFFRNNVSGNQDLMIYATVYGHNFYQDYHTWSDSWSEYFRETPAPGYQFLFVYVVVWVDTETGDDCRPYGFDKDHWRVQYGNRIYEPIKYYDPAWRIREMETVSNYNKDSFIVPYGVIRRFDNDRGWVADPLGWIKGGRSNAWDGYLIYEVPETATEDKLKVIGRFENLGYYAWWQLK